MQLLKTLRRSPRLLVVGVALLLVAAATAYGATQQPAIQTITPQTEDQITNIDVLRQQIKISRTTGIPVGNGGGAYQARGDAAGTEACGRIPGGR